ncbi:hypothetical protein [Neorhizobium sp. 2083]|uniref:hypothetical protein n=1 Tax=Neorhizobium sp. 2083 TaxID=2817762 RepID=UPI00386209D2
MAAEDQFATIEVVEGSAFDDVFVGDTSNNHFIGGSGADSFNGGTGTDLVWYIDSATAIVADLSTGVITAISARQPEV